ncbi:WD40-repeat-containing domain protein [Melanogaster broomeanus]|nr:WD40-repeat-containing domain protein [Melanogaster broomeanus]KAF9230237.1 WD40-repeat-containing domain protein [Melanogaster broomeanus]
MPRRIITHRLKWELQGHLSSVNSLAFSDDATMLASAGDDRYILVWTLAEGRLVQRLSPKQGPIAVVRWFSDSQESKATYLISGGADGTMRLWKKSSMKEGFMEVMIETISDAAIEDITVEDGARLVGVTSAGRFYIYEIQVKEQVPLRRIVVEPPHSATPQQALARSVHFFDGGRSVFAMYLDSKEIIAWSVSPWKRLWRHRLRTRLGYVAWSPDSRHLAVWNLCDSVDLYQINERPVWLRTFKSKIRRNNIKQVALGWADEIMLNGGDNSEVFLWDIDSALVADVISHDPEGHLVQTISYHSPRNRRHLIATASSDPQDDKPMVKVWVVNDISESDVNSRQEIRIKGPSDVTTIDGTRNKSTTCSVFIMAVILCSIIMAAISVLVSLGAIGVKITLPH